MKIIDKRTGIDIMQCENIDILRNIILNNIRDTNSLMEDYAEFALHCYKSNINIIYASDWLKIKDK